jgi:hypothetical protein
MTENSECSICWDEFDNTVIKLKCGHYFHCKCIGKAYKMDKCKNMCPFCRNVDIYAQIKLRNFIKKLNVKRCQGILKSGKNKGKLCNCKAYSSTDYCKRHGNIPHKS